MLTYYVDPDSAGGDGTTPALTGANAAYQTFTAAEAARNTGTLTEVVRIECRSSDAAHTADTSVTMIAGATASAAAYFELYVNPSHQHDGKWNTSKYRRTAGLYIGQNYTRVEGSQYQGSGNFGGADLDSAIGVVVQKCIASQGWANRATFSSNGTSTADFINCIAYDSQAPGFHGNSTGIINFINCTAVNTNLGGLGSAGFIVEPGWTARNCLGKGNYGVDFGFSGTSTATNCASADASADDAGTSVDCRINQTFTFAGTGDYKLSPSDAGARTYGTETGAPADDVIGQTRVGRTAIDIGAHQVTQTEAGPSFMAAWALQQTQMIGGR